MNTYTGIPGVDALIQAAIYSGVGMLVIVTVYWVRLHSRPRGRR